MKPQAILTLYLVLFALEYLWETLLTVLNIRHVRAHAQAPPEPFRGVIDQETYRKSVDYTLTRNRFALISDTASSIFLLLVILSGSLGWIDTFLERFQLHPYLHGIVYIFVLSAVFGLFSLPFTLYSIFVIEERFGFNKMTWKLFLIDGIKSLILSVVIMTPLLYGLFWFMDATGKYWWVWAFLFLAGFQLLMVVIYPTVIAPWFNKFSPLEEGSLRDKIIALAEKVRFRTSGIFVMDGSKRSKHSNAYFTGLGRVKRIVLFDTLIDTLGEDQVVSVLAHEIGHEKKNHIKKGLILSLVGMLFGLWILSLLLHYEPFFQAFGFSRPSYHAAIILFGFCSGPFTFFLTPLGSILSRKYEYEADRFAVDATGTAEFLKQALLKLSKDNLSNLTPHPWYSFYHYSHPTLAERLKAMEEYAKKKWGDVGVAV